jgi:hypothetical protein
VPGVLRDLHAAALDGAGNDVVPDLLVILALLRGGLDRLLRAEQRDAAAGDISLLGRCASRVQGIINEILQGLHGDLAGAADVDDGHAAGELGVPFHQLLAVVIAGGLVVLSLDLRRTTLDVGLLAGPFDDRRVVLGDDDLFGPTELVQLDRLERPARGPLR